MKNVDKFIEFISDTKTYNRCQEDKNISDFYKLGNDTRKECKSCTNKVTSKYRKNNPELIKKIKKKYNDSEIGRDSNKKNYQKYRKEIPENVRIKLAISHKNYCKKRYNNDSKYKLIVSIRNLIGKSFKYKNKPLKTEEILGCKSL